MVQFRESWKGGGKGRDHMNITYYIDAKRITQAGRKKSQLLHLAGLDLQDIFKDLVDPGSINTMTDDVYKIFARKLNAHFRVDDNVPYERHVFRHMVPLTEESPDKFLVRLRNRQDIVILMRPSEKLVYLLMLWEQKEHLAELVSVVQRMDTSLVIEIVLQKEVSVQNVENMTISLAFRKVDLSSILPRLTLRNSLLFIAVVLDNHFVEREKWPTLSMRLHNRVKMI